MANEIYGTYTIKQVLLATYQFFHNRFTYEKRDVIKRVTIRKITNLHPTRALEPSIRYQIETKSYPQYPPYFTGKDSRGRIITKQRKIHHEYDCFLEIDKLSLNTTHWKMRIGSNKKIRKAPPSEIKTIPKKVKEKWKQEQNRLVLKARTETQKAKAKRYYIDKVNTHQRRAKYLNEGDWIAKTLGINLDFAYRCAFAYKYYGHLYDRWYYILYRPSKLNQRNIMFFPKHALRLVEFLMNNGILKDS